MPLKRIFNKFRSKLLNAELELLKLRSRRRGYDLIPRKVPSYSEIIIDNYYETEYKKNALLSYLIDPFINEIQKNHSNYRECFIMSEIMHELGYNVDIINWDNTTFIPKKKYDLVIDNHDNLKRLSSYFSNETAKVFHATNAHWLYQNATEYNRCFHVFEKYGRAVEPVRLRTPGNSAEHCDVISMFGNEFTAATYGKYSHMIQHLPMSVSTDPEIIMGKDFGKAKKNFIWFNSYGALLKGLDVIIEAFNRVPDLELFVCGKLEPEAGLIQTTMIQSKITPNIDFQGWVETDGEEFKKLLLETAWVISASFSEGGGGSILNCMAKGLIPIISRSTSITLPDNTGFYIENNETATLDKLLLSLSQLPDATVKELSLHSFEFISSNHTLKNFKQGYTNFLQEITLDLPVKM